MDNFGYGLEFGIAGQDDTIFFLGKGNNKSIGVGKSVIGLDAFADRFSA